MDVSSVSGSPLLDPRSHGDRTTAAPAAPAAQRPAAPPAAERQPAPAVDTSPRVDVEVTQDSSGGAHTKVVDVRTGLPVLEMPPEHVVQVIDGILWRLRHAKSAQATTEGTAR